MAEWEQTDALVHWLANFEPESDAFLQDTNKLLDGRFFAQVYNKLSTDPIDISRLKAITNENDWVNMLLNLRQIGSHISSFLKESGFDMSVDLSLIARKKDQSELLKLLKYFLLYAMKAPNRKIAITNVRALDKLYQTQIQAILEEFTKKKTQPRAYAAHKPTTEDLQQNQKLQSLNNEIDNLKMKSTELLKQVRQKTEDMNQLNVDVAAKMETTISVMKNQFSEEKAKRDKILEKIHKYETLVTQTKSKLSEMRAKELQISKDINDYTVTDLTVQQLEAKLLILKQRAININNNDDFNRHNNFSPSANIEEIVTLFNVHEKREKVTALKEEHDASEKNRKLKKAELLALQSTLDAQNAKASEAMLRRVAQLNFEMDASPLGESQRKSFRLRRIIQKLGSEIEELERSGASMELPILTDELTRMAKRKAKEADLLARKLSYMQTTAEQCGIRLMRLKLNVGLQMHSNRLKRWQNCFMQNKTQEEIMK